MILPGGGARPAVSVIIATYNWSAVLACAIESVLLQTFSNFELLVVGDACTDDSEDVVRSFGDRRVRWINLPDNHGSQYGPNNVGLTVARGDYIAYLGHDDLWWPTHLASTLSTAQAKEADVVAAMTILHGPPGSGVLGATGLFPGGEYSPRFFFPPSSMLHTKALAERVGGWRPPGEAIGAVDYDLLLRFHQAGATFAATGELTTFKFNAAWRRNAYRTRSAEEQTALLAIIRERDEGFRNAALTSIIQSVIEDRFVRIEAPPEQMRPATIGHALSGSFKGSRRHKAPRTVGETETSVRFFVDDANVGYEWHSVEEVGETRQRWTGPANRSSFRLPVRIDRAFELRIGVALIAAPDEAAARASASLMVDDRPLDSRWEAQPDGTWLWCARLDPADHEGRDIELVTIAFPHPRRPLDLGWNDDRRWLGLCVRAIELVPLPAAP